MGGKLPDSELPRFLDAIFVVAVHDLAVALHWLN